MRNGKRLNGFASAADDPVPPPVCDHADCDEPGLYPAPKSREQLREYYWFCLDHVREYNKSWDFFGGIDAEGIERQIRKDTVWERPTWPLGRWGLPGRDKIDAALRRAFGFDLGGGPRPDPDAGQSRKTSAAEAEALRILELEPPVTWAEVRARYKGLAKRLHPDANGGDKAAEEQLKLINRAYSALKSAMAP